MAEARVSVLVKIPASVFERLEVWRGTGSRMAAIVELIEAGLGSGKKALSKTPILPPPVAKAAPKIDPMDAVDEAPVAQEVEPAAHNGLVAGSSPAGRTTRPIGMVTKTMGTDGRTGAPLAVFRKLKGYDGDREIWVDAEAKDWFDWQKKAPKE